MIEAELRLKVRYERMADPQEAKRLLTSLVEHAVDNGLLTGEEGSAEVASYGHEVIVDSAFGDGRKRKK